MPPAPYRSKREIFSILATVAAALAVVAIVFVARYIILAALVGVGFGVLIAPVMNRMQGRYRIPRGLSAIAVVVLILGGTIGIGYGLYALLSNQVQSLIAQAPELTMRLEHQAERLLRSAPWLRRQVDDLNLSQAARTTIMTLFQGVQTGASALAGFVLLLAMASYTAINSRSYFEGLLLLFPAHSRPRAAQILRGAALVLRKWFRSQVIVMLVSGSVTTLALWILGIDYWLLLGVLTGLFGFIPYIGSILTLVVTGLVTLGSDPEKIFWVIGVYLGIQQLEGHVTIPLIMKGGVQLPEVHAIVFMLIMGSVFGLLGVFVAPPLLAVIRHIMFETYVRSMNQRTIPPAQLAKDASEPAA